MRGIFERMYVRLCLLRRLVGACVSPCVHVVISLTAVKEHKKHDYSLSVAAVQMAPAVVGGYRFSHF